MSASRRCSPFASCTQRYGHIQEIIVQNFVPKQGTIMADAPPADAEELLWSIAAARLLFGPRMSIQAPPNLSPAPLPALVGAGINDWGGVSPLTPDFVNPEAPWPEIEHLRVQTEAAGKTLAAAAHHLSGVCEIARRSGSTPACAARCWSKATAMRSDAKTRGARAEAPIFRRASQRATGASTGPASARSIREIVDFGAEQLGRRYAIAELFTARGGDFREVCEAADRLRARGQRRHRDLRREPQHQLHQHLRLPLQLLRLLEGHAQARGRRAGVSARCRARSSRRSLEARRARGDRGVPAGRHPSELHGRDLSRDLARGESGGSRHARACLLAARGMARRRDAAG